MRMHNPIRSKGRAVSNLKPTETTGTLKINPLEPKEGFTEEGLHKAVDELIDREYEKKQRNHNPKYAPILKVNLEDKLNMYFLRFLKIRVFRGWDNELHIFFGVRRSKSNVLRGYTWHIELVRRHKKKATANERSKKHN